jgi:hypothetical protein
MPNTKTNRGLKQDRSRVAGGQNHEISYIREKYGVSTQQVTGAIRAVGNDRKKIEEYLKSK